MFRKIVSGTAIAAGSAALSAAMITGPAVTSVATVTSGPAAASAAAPDTFYHS
jgi:hypothetical protein